MPPMLTEKQEAVLKYIEQYQMRFGKSPTLREMREHFGAGWRMYYIQRGQLLIVMLGGGDKSSQQRDIERAIALAKTLED